MRSRWRALGARLRPHRLALVIFALASVWVMSNMWLDPAGRIMSNNPGGDQELFEWMLQHTAYCVTHFENPLGTHLMNAPKGVNLMANTSVIAIGIVMTPFTLLLGAPFAYTLAMTIGLFGTAAGWYYVLVRHLRLSRLAAFVGAALCAFGPATMSHANAHLNFTAMILVPFIIAQILRLREDGRWLRSGICLGLLLTVQMFIGEEIVFLIALFMMVFTLFYAFVQWDDVRSWIGRYAKGLGIAAAVATPLLAFPLWWQFFGPQSYVGIPWAARSFEADVASYVALPTGSIAGTLQPPGFALRHNPTEENAFYGWGLALLVIVFAVWLWRNHRALRAAALASLVFILFSFGPEIKINGWWTGIPGPYRLVEHIPLIDSTLPTRLSLPLLPVVALMVAFGIDKVRAIGADLPKPRRGESAVRHQLRLGWFAAVAVALLPLLPLPVVTSARTPIPAFFTDGAWKPYVSDGGTLVPVPLPGDVNWTGMRWQVAADLGFAIPLGAFIGPNVKDHDKGMWSAPRNPTANLIFWVTQTGQVPEVTDVQRAQARVDLEGWKAEVVVLQETAANTALLSMLTDMLGEPVKVKDVWVWDVRGFVAGE
ncbi:glycosyl transferase [Actinorhabdospora filicis]|uniref:Glycosyl transferase n=1 Tax=Actinorhabdospora filicis TaxID=1785913 RepID=A0A9W6SUE4_9ACTN|nr:hypothetical protein [Actinorhabdospora filicis]GLZ82110.1 glycosyl transferase [Actinorhabdospora filicis]